MRGVFDMSVSLLHMDCMEYMATLEDNAFDLAIVDPPYGINAANMNMGDGYYGKGRKDRLSSGAGKLKGRNIQIMKSEWDEKPPSREYFLELERVSVGRIIWGGNYFDLPPTRGIVAWDKCQPWPNFSAFELAWTSFDSPAKLFRFNNAVSGKIHPTQKPVKLYKWLLKNYAKEGQRILDTHLGSGSSAIAAHYFGVDFVGCELDADYYKAACERFDRETRQIDMFSAKQEVITT
jgi:site-specific DNA-methyltransferase (adenine-specific)